MAFLTSNVDLLYTASNDVTATRKRIDLFRKFTHTVGLEIRLADTVHTFTSLISVPVAATDHSASYCPQIQFRIPSNCFARRALLGPCE